MNSGEMNHPPSSGPPEKEEKAIHAIFLRNLRMIRGLAVYLVPFPDAVDDIVQQVFVEFVSKEKKWNLDHEAEVRSLLAVLTRQITLRWWHQRRRHVPETLAKIVDRLRCDPRVGGSEPTPYEEEMEILGPCIELLPARGRAMIRMYYFEGRTTREMAVVFETSEDTIRRNLSRLRVRLREYVQKLKEERSRDESSFQ